MRYSRCSRRYCSCPRACSAPTQGARPFGLTPADAPARGMISALDALARLRDGNRRFVVDVKSRETLPSRARRIELAAGQEPFAAILGCSDSRVPVEIVFDQGLGDLFSSAWPATSSPRRRWAASNLPPKNSGTRLVVVLGHSNCRRHPGDAGFAAAAHDNQSPQSALHRHMIRPSVEDLLATDLVHDVDALVHQAVRPTFARR